MKTFSIYLIYNDDYWYVGSTTRGALTRRVEHFAGRGQASLLADKITELGQDAFKITLLAGGWGLDPVAVEAEWYDRLLATDPRQTLNGKRPGGWDGYDFVRSEETLAKMSAAHRGKTLTPEHRAKISASLMGGTRTHSPEQRAKISASLMGRVVPPERRAKIRAAGKGHVVTAETRAKISASRKGMKFSDEHRANLSTAQKARFAKQDSTRATNGKFGLLTVEEM